MSEPSIIDIHESEADNHVDEGSELNQAVLPPGTASETDGLLDTLRRGLAPDADDASRAAARDACQRIALVLGTSLPIAPVPNAASVVPPLVQMATALARMPVEQLMDVAIARLRAARPAGAAPEGGEARPGFRPQFVPVPAGRR